MTDNDTQAGVHDPRTCPECQEMIKRGGHRIIDLLGHAGYTAYRSARPRLFTVPWSDPDAREGWAQAAAVITEEWSGGADNDAEDLDRVLGDVYECTRTWEAWDYGTMTEDDFRPAGEAIRDELLNWRDAAVLRALALPTEAAAPSRRRFPLHVRFSYPDNGYEAAQEHARKYLTVGEVYTIRTMEVGQSSTYLTLYGLPRGEQFSSVLFEPYWPPDDDDDREGT